DPLRTRKPYRSRTPRAPIPKDRFGRGRGRHCADRAAERIETAYRKRPTPEAWRRRADRSLPTTACPRVFLSTEGEGRPRAAWLPTAVQTPAARSSPVW